MNILIISPEPWDTHEVSKHHYARTVAARGHRVAFLEPPDTQKSRLAIERLAQEEGQLWKVCGPRVAPGLRFMPPTLRRALEARWVAKLEGQLGFSFDVVWLFENSRFADMSFAGERIKIYHQVDLNQDFNVADAARSADICFAVSDIIKRRLEPHARRVVTVGHGVRDMPGFDATCNAGGTVQSGRFQACYVGNLESDELDLQVLKKTILGSPEVDFHLIGRYAEDGVLYAELKDIPNCRLWGRIPSSSIPAAMAQMHVLMIAKNVARYGDQLANPHKIMEYLASGNVTVATWTEAFQHLAGDLIVMVKDQNDYPAAFRAAVRDLDRLNAPELREARIAYARDNTYERQLDRINAALKTCERIAPKLASADL